MKTSHLTFDVSRPETYFQLLVPLLSMMVKMHRYNLRRLISLLTKLFI